MTELEKIAHAKTYIEKLANGIDPRTNRAASETDLINQVYISRCLFYVADVLRQIVDAGGLPSQGAHPQKWTAQRNRPKPQKAPFRLDYEARKNFCYSDVPITISEITLRINALIDSEQMTKLSYKSILTWLIETGFLFQISGAGGKAIRKPTAAGEKLGISLDYRQGPEGPYTVVMYSREAQEFILDHLDAILA